MSHLHTQVRDFVSVAQFYETLLYWTRRGRYSKLSEPVVPDFRGNDTHVSSIISHFTFPLRKEKQKKYAPNFQLRLKPF